MMTKQDMIDHAKEMLEEMGITEARFTDTFTHHVLAWKDSTILSWYSKKSLNTEYKKLVKNYEGFKKEQAQPTIEEAMELATKIDKELTAMENELDTINNTMEEMEIAMGMKPCPKCDDVCTHDYDTEVQETVQQAMELDVRPAPNVYKVTFKHLLYGTEYIDTATVSCSTTKDIDWELECYGLDVLEIVQIEQYLQS